MGDQVLEQDGLAAAGRAHDGHHVPPPNQQVHSAEDRIVSEGFAHSFDAYFRRMRVGGGFAGRFSLFQRGHTDKVGCKTRSGDRLRWVK